MQIFRLAEICKQSILLTPSVSVRLFSTGNTADPLRPYSYTIPQSRFLLLPNILAELPLFLYVAHTHAKQYVNTRSVAICRGFQSKLLNILSDFFGFIDCSTSRLRIRVQKLLCSEISTFPISNTSIPQKIWRTALYKYVFD